MEYKKKRDLFYFPYYYSNRVTYEKKKFIFFILCVFLIPVIIFLIANKLK